MAHDLHAGLGQHLQRGIDDHVQLEQRRAAEAVDEQDHFLPARQRQVFQDRAGQLGGDLVRAAELDALASRLAMDADAHFHLVGADLEGRLAGLRHGAGGERDAHRGGRLVDRVAECFQRCQVVAALGRRADDALDDQRAGHAAAPGGVGRVLDRHVVVDDHGRVVAVEHLGRHLEVHHVAGIVLHDEEHTGACVHGRGRGEHLVGRGRSEDLAGAGRVEHAVADEAGVQRLVAGTATRDQRDLAGFQRAPADELVCGAERHDVGMRRRETVERFGEHGVDVVDQLFHAVSSGNGLSAGGFKGCHRPRR